MSNGFLSKEQLKEYTGWTHKSKQIEELQKEGIPYRVNAKGEIVVSWDHVNNKESAGAFLEPAWSE